MDRWKGQPSLWDTPEQPEPTGQTATAQGTAPESAPPDQPQEAPARVPSSPPAWPTEWFYADPEGSLYRKAKATYSADRLGAHSKLRGAFVYGGRTWFSTGDAFIDWKAHPDLSRNEWIGVQCREIVPATSWKGETTESYHELVERWNAEKLPHGLPRGYMAGLVVYWRGARYVCTGLRLQVVVCIAVKIGAPKSPLPERPGVITVDDPRLLETARLHYAPSALRQEKVELARVWLYDGPYWITTGSMYGNPNTRGEWVEEVSCLELIPREEWGGPTRTGTQRIKGEAEGVIDTSCRGVEALCLEDSRRYVCTGHTLTLRHTRNGSGEGVGE